MKFKYNYVLVYRWYIEDDRPTNIDLFCTPFSWNHEKIQEYVKINYGKHADFEIITNELKIAKEG